MLARLLLVALQAIPAQSAPATIWGQVRSGSTGSPLAFAVVEVRSGHGPLLRTETDQNGRYILRDVPSGQLLVRASHIDHAPLELDVTVGPGRTQAVNFDLEVRPLRLPGVATRAPGLETPFRDTVSVKPGDLGTAAVRALEATPGVAEMGLAEAAREVPGHEPVDPSDVLFVRGGTADLKLVMLNGAPVFAPFHVGGLINALDTDLFRSATLYVGGAPARYDGGLAYVMDMETRSGRDSGLHGDMAVDMLAAKGMVEGRLAPGASFLASARGVHGLGATPFVGDPFPYSYGDAVSRLDVDLGGGRILSVTGFWNREAVRLDSLVRPDEVAAWGNGAGSIRLRTVMGETDGLFTLAVGDFQTTLPVGGLRVLLTEGTSRHSRAAADFGRTLGPGRLTSAPLSIGWPTDNGSALRLKTQHSIPPPPQETRLAHTLTFPPTRPAGCSCGVACEPTSTRLIHRFALPRESPPRCCSMSTSR